MSTDRLRVGIIGIGRHSATGHVPWLRDTGRAEVVAISRRNAERLAFIQKELAVPEAYTDWGEMLDQAELDAVVVSTPNYLHAEHSIAALERGLHVLVEKPMALTYRDACRMVQAADTSRRVLMVGYNGRGMESWRAVKRLLEGGTIGRIRQVAVACALDARLFWQDVALSERVQNLAQSSPLNAMFWGAIIRRERHWPANPGMMGGGVGFVDVGTHVMDLMLWLSGAPPTQVVAFDQTGGGGSASIMDVQARLANGASLSLTLNDNVAGGEFDFYGQGRLTAYGDGGLLIADWRGYMIKEAEQIWIEREGSREKLEAKGARVTPDAAFVAAVLDGAPNMCPAREAAQVVALTQAAYLSAEQGRIVEIGQLTAT
jgi:predicted dehydrogenase